MMESVLGFIILKFIMWIFPLRKIEDVSGRAPQEGARGLYALTCHRGQVHEVDRGSVDQGDQI